MRCYKCNSVLSDTDFCNGCGADVTTYKKIVKMSNTYYNVGLEKAKIRDLSGAADLLKRSVRLDKNNIDARNLLGLVYFEMGECVEAMSEWVISKNIKPEKNMADKYLSDIQSNPGRLDLINQTAKKFNTALAYANDGSDDLAIVQLKRILNMTPNFVKAAHLLAVLYMKNDEYEKARKVLIKIEKIDKRNTLTAKYLDEIDRKLVKDSGKSITRLKRKDEEERPALSGDDVIIPQTGYREGNSVAVNILNVLVGIILGAALVFFLITPARVKVVREEYNDKLNEYAAQGESNNLSINTLQNTIKSLEEEVAALKTTISNQDEALGQVAKYDELIMAAAKYIADDKVGCADLLVTMDVSGITSEQFISLYNGLKNSSYTFAADEYYYDGAEYFDNNKYDEAVAALVKAFTFNSTDPKITYELAKSYRGQNGNKLNDDARKYFQLTISLDPDGVYGEYAKSFIG
ncbi:MAG: hypothetical protein E7266_05070 [Lachnospiraceae bacterium]|nr:hypothetical protein [Lachnospiraceae bacterium]